MRAFYAARPGLSPTPARSLPGLARHLGVAAVTAKDESGRFGLNAFKLGPVGFLFGDVGTYGYPAPLKTIEGGEGESKFVLSPFIRVGIRKTIGG